jgi:hypothetical protein
MLGNPSQFLPPQVDGTDYFVEKSQTFIGVEDSTNSNEAGQQ